MLLQDEEKQDNSGDEEDDSGSEECDDYEAYRSDNRLIAALDKLPQKNIVYCSNDIENILGVFDVVKEIVSETKTSGINFKSALLTADILSEDSYYSQLTGRTLLRWYELKDRQSEEPGRKINGKKKKKKFGGN